MRLNSHFKKRISYRNYPIPYTVLLLALLFYILSIFNVFMLAPKVIMLILLFSVAISLGKTKAFLKDWLAFLAFLYLADTLRGLIYIVTCHFRLPVYTTYIANAERFLFGKIPSAVLQNTLLRGDSLADMTWLEKSLTIIHGTHFVAFLLVGLLIWLHRSEYFSAYKVSFTSLILLGLTSYLLIPTTPPWMASELFKIIPKITHFNEMLYNMIIPDLTIRFDTNPIAAMPSLHTAFPVLASLIVWRVYRWKALPLFAYTGLILFAIVYTGDHYIIDIIGGILLASFCYGLFLKVKRRAETPSKRRSATTEAVFRRRQFLLGSVILALAMIIGYQSRKRFDANYYYHDIHAAVPNYVDFFKHNENYEDNYNVQFYYGSHLMHHGEYGKALDHFRKSRDLSENLQERDQSLKKIAQCDLLLRKRSNIYSPASQGQSNLER
ncbi:MAG: phosphatase PAP2 family protein [Candidatus Aminicenantes bacterium]|nr:phosphatase PAP2 family protein [Candidatus Aminicenantes bacterium]